MEEILDWAAARGIPGISVINVFKDPTSPARFRDDCRDYAIEPSMVDRLFDRLTAKRPGVRRADGDPHDPVPGV